MTNQQTEQDNSTVLTECLMKTWDSNKNFSKIHNYYQKECPMYPVLGYCHAFSDSLYVKAPCGKEDVRRTSEQIRV